MTADTIYALSSGSPPAAIAVVRISGPAADRALLSLTGRLPEPRTANLAWLREDDRLLDRALVLRFPGPASATGEDLVELHLHGGRAVIGAVTGALGRIEGLRPAEPGEFTRRSFESGRIDLAEAEGLADLLQAETESQREAALSLASGSLSRRVEAWQSRLLALSAQMEAVLDFSDEGEVGEGMPPRWDEAIADLAREIRFALGAAPVERLRDGVRVVIAGPPNAGKSSLLNVLIGRDAAITSAIPGTTRDLVEAPTSIAGTPFLLIDTAGLRDSVDEIEAIGIEKARTSLAKADIILWLGSPDDAPSSGAVILVRPKADLAEPGRDGVGMSVSARTGEGVDRLVTALIARAGELLPKPSEVSLNARHRLALREALEPLESAGDCEDPLIASELLRLSRIALDKVTGRAGVEEMLDALFGRFCIGK
ncbi:MAG: mnmE [Alphaproteobacteria bacterium]|nr:mnmE [Alphaproteobacteria bacterium]